MCLPIPNFQCLKPLFKILIGFPTFSTVGTAPLAMGSGSQPPLTTTFFAGRARAVTVCVSPLRPSCCMTSYRCSRCRRRRLRRSVIPLHLQCLRHAWRRRGRGRGQSRQMRENIIFTERALKRVSRVCRCKNARCIRRRRLRRARGLCDGCGAEDRAG